MAGFVRISEAAALGLHAAVMMAAQPRRPLAVRKAALKLKASGAHLSKVMQRLARSGVVNAVRGPRGGFVLSRDPSGINLLEVYEAVDGRCRSSVCLFKKPACRSRRCMILGELLENVGGQVRDYLSGTTLARAAGVYRKGGAG